MTKNKWIMRFIKPYKNFFICEFFCITLMTTVGSILPYMNGKLVNAAFYDKDMHAFIKLCILYAGIMLFHQLVISAIATFIRAHLMTGFVFDIRRAVFKKILHKKGTDLQGMYSGDMVSRINYDTYDFMDLIFNSGIRGWASILNIVYSVGFMCCYNIYLGIYTVAIVPIVVFASRYYKKKLKAISKDIARERGKLSSYLFEVVKSMQELKVLNACKNVIHTYSKRTKMIDKMEVEKGRIGIQSEQINTFIVLIARLILFVICAYCVVEGRMLLGAFVAAISYFNRAVANFDAINSHIVDIGRQSVSIQRVIDILNDKDEEYNEEIPPQKINHGEIEFNNVVFSYNDNKCILDRVNLKISAGSVIGLVGKSGVGKTTFCNLLYKLYVVDRGEILIDGVNINTYNLHSLRSQIGIVHQEPTLYEGTLRYNLSLADNSDEDEQLICALKKVALYDWYLTLSDGLNTYLGTNENGMSGGQKQRLAIARIFIKDPKIFIFDESTSSLDSQNEFIIRDIISNLSKERTVIIISHRLSTIKNCDKIIVLADGKITGFDTHDYLIKNNKDYINLFNKACSKGEMI